MGLRVTLFACTMHKTESWKRETIISSLASCRASSDAPCIRSTRPLYISIISLTRREKGAFGMMGSVLFWYFLISRSATVPGLHFLFFFVFGGEGGGATAAQGDVCDLKFFFFNLHSSSLAYSLNFPCFLFPHDLRREVDVVACCCGG